MRKNRNTRLIKEFRGSGFGHKEWENMGCFRNPIVCCSISVIFYIVWWKDSLSSVDVSMVSRTTLKPCASLCELFFYLFVLELLLSTSKLPLAQQLVSEPRFRLGRVGEILGCRTQVVSLN